MDNVVKFTFDDQFCTFLSSVLLVKILTSTYAFLNGRGGGQSEHERGREGGKDGPFNQHTRT